MIMCPFCFKVFCGDGKIWAYVKHSFLGLIWQRLYCVFFQPFELFNFNWLIFVSSWMNEWILNECSEWWKQMWIYLFLCCWDLWEPSEFLDMNDFPQRSHGIEIPAMWLASMWLFISRTGPSCPQTLQIRLLAPLLLFGSESSLDFISDFTFWSNIHVFLVILLAFSLAWLP